jgi:hypothetical protein
MLCFLAAAASAWAPGVSGWSRTGDPGAHSGKNATARWPFPWAPCKCTRHKLAFRPQIQVVLDSRAKLSRKKHLTDGASSKYAQLLNLQVK